MVVLVLKFLQYKESHYNSDNLHWYNPESIHLPYYHIKKSLSAAKFHFL